MVKAPEAKPTKPATKSVAKPATKTSTKTTSKAVVSKADASKKAEVAAKPEKMVNPASSKQATTVPKESTVKTVTPKTTAKQQDTVVQKVAASRPAGKYFYAVWRRKTSTAVVKLFPKGTGQLIVQADAYAVPLKEYFGGATYMYENACYPFSIIGSSAEKKFDAEIILSGGGHAGQSEAVRLAFARALIEFSPEYRLQLKPYGLLKRDPRKKERKKPGLLKARKSPQWSKR